MAQYYQSVGFSKITPPSIKSDPLTLAQFRAEYQNMPVFMQMEMDQKFREQTMPPGGLEEREWRNVLARITGSELRARIEELQKRISLDKKEIAVCRILIRAIDVKVRMEQKQEEKERLKKKQQQIARGEIPPEDDDYENEPISRPKEFIQKQKQKEDCKP